MSLIAKWLESLSIDVHITASCSWQVSSKSTCTACLDHCPAKALSLEGNNVKINPSQCHSCGECIIVCPVSAITGIMPKRQLKNGMLVYESYYCPTVKELLIYRKKGIKGIAIPDDWYDEEWKNVIGEVNDLLPQLSLQPFFFKKLEEIKEPGVTRRELFIFAKTKGHHFAAELTPASWRQNPKVWALPVYFPDYQFYEVKLDKEKCSLCQGCFSLCSQGALNMTETEIMIDNHKCTNCSICVDACPEGAIYVISKVGRKSEARFRYEKRKCKRCKQSYLIFQQDDPQNGGSGLCHVCSNMSYDWLMP